MANIEPIGLIKFLDCDDTMMTTYEMFDAVKILTEGEFYNVFVVLSNTHRKNY